MKRTFTILLLLFIAFPIVGQDIAVFSGTKNPTTATVSNLTAEPLSRGPALTVAGGNTFNSGNWATGDKLNVNSYIEWSVTADAGYIINISELQINFDRDPDGLSHFFTGNGPSKIRLRTSLDNFTTDIYSNDKVSNSGLSPVIETALQSTTGGTITFRIYGFSSTIGMLGPLGTFDIEGGLGKIMGLDHVGIRLAGTVTYDGLLYTNNQWIPRPPSPTTAEDNVFIVDGTYTVSDKVQVKNLTVHPGAGIVIQKTGAITVNGHLTTADNLTLHSDDDQFSSLIVSDSVIGTAKYQQKVSIATPIGGSGNSMLVAAPLSGEAFNVFRQSNPNITTNKVKTLALFGPFNKVKSAYATYSNNETTPLTAGTGYRTAIVKNGVLNFAGTVNTQAIHKPILNSGTDYPEWNLIGNPYPSYLKLRDFLAANNADFSSEASGLYSFHGDPTNGWTIWNLAYLTLHPDAHIAPGQGFFVASKAGGGTVTFVPEMRTVGPLKSFGVQNEQVSKKTGFLKLHLTNGIASYGTDFYFNEQSTPGLDPGYDAAIFGDLAPDFAIYSHLLDDHNDKDMAVQSLPYSDLLNGTVIPIGINAAKGQQLRIAIASAILPEETEVYMEDKLSQTFTLLSRHDYVFYADANVAGTGRFFLHVIPSTLFFGDHEDYSPQLFTSNGSRMLHINGVVRPNTSLMVYDLQDRLLLSVLLDEQATEQHLDLSDLSKGMYVVKLKNSFYDKIMKILVQ